MLLDLLLLVARGRGDHNSRHHRLARVRSLIDGTVTHRHHALPHIPFWSDQDNVQLGMEVETNYCGGDETKLHEISCHIDHSHFGEEKWGIRFGAHELHTALGLVKGKLVDQENWILKLFELNSFTGQDAMPQQFVSMEWTVVWLSGWASAE